MIVTISSPYDGTGSTHYVGTVTHVQNSLGLSSPEYLPLESTHVCGETPGILFLSLPPFTTILLETRSSLLQFFSFTEPHENVFFYRTIFSTEMWFHFLSDNVSKNIKYMYPPGPGPVRDQSPEHI